MQQIFVYRYLYIASQVSVIWLNGDEIQDPSSVALMAHAYTACLPGVQVTTGVSYHWLFY